jgi:hypothetical protein
MHMWRSIALEFLLGDHNIRFLGGVAMLFGGARVLERSGRLGVSSLFPREARSVEDVRNIFKSIASCLDEEVPDSYQLFRG